MWGQPCFQVVIARICRPVRTVVWLWEGGTLWRAKWTRRGHKEPHPSITRVDKGDSITQSWKWPLANFFSPHPHAATRVQPGARRWVFPPYCTPGATLFPGEKKVADCSWCVSAQSWAQSGRGGIERHRETQAARRESERSGPLFLCLMRGALRGELAGMLRHASPQLSAALTTRCPDLIVKRRWLQVRVWRRGFPYTFFLSLLLCLLEMLRRARQSKCLSEVCGGKECFAHAAIKGTVGSLWS